MLKEEIETFINEEEPIYKNPSTIELNKLVRGWGENVRIIANGKTKSFYVFSYTHLHFTITRRISEFKDIQSLIATSGQPPYILTASGRIEDGKITLTDSDILRWSKYAPIIRVQVKLRDWSFCNKYLNNDIKNFLKKIKIDR